MLKKLAKAIAPPILVAAVRHFRAGRHPDPKAITFTGDYACWADAQRDSAGYDSAVILQKTRDALLKVKRGEAAFERDSIVFQTMEHEFALLAALLRAAVEKGGSLNVLDFGGALGSSYFQCRKFLSILPHLRWSVVEQSAHVACGRAEFSNDELYFYETVELCLENETPDLLLLSGVLQYLRKPHKTLARLLSHRIPHVFIDRTTVFLDDTADRLTVQTVPEWIYPASYPCWMLNYNGLLQLCTGEYQVVAEFPAHADVSIRFENGSVAVYRGLLLHSKGVGARQ